MQNNLPSWHVLFQRHSHECFSGSYCNRECQSLLQFKFESKTPILRPKFVSLLQSYKGHGIKQVKSIHAKIIRNGLEQDPFVIFELLRVYCKINAADYATKVFHCIEIQNVYLYTALIDGFVSFGSYVDALCLYTKMVKKSILPDNYVIASVLKACVLQFALRNGREVHGQVLKFGLSSNRLIALRLIKMYGKCEQFNDAWKVFDKMPGRDVVASTVMITSYFDHGMVEEAISVFDGLQTRDTVCWTAMIDGLVGNGELNKALEIFREMQAKGVEPNEVNTVCVLSVCSQLGALEHGKWVHMYMRKCNIKLNLFVAGALINMYSKCGDIVEAQAIFYEIKVRDVSTYNSMIAGLAMHGKSIEAIDLFREMINTHLRPNSITFVNVLNACSHGGLLDLGYEIFQSMKRDHGIEPQAEHYGCMVDILGKVGRLEEAYNFIKRMRVHLDNVMLCALLCACKTHGNTEIGEQVANLLGNCSCLDSGSYVMLSNYYASSGRWSRAVQVRKKMGHGDILKEPGCSSIEVNSEIHEFISGDQRHPQKKRIYEKLEELHYLAKMEGHSPATEVAIHDSDVEQKRWALAVHGEDLH